MINLDGFHKMLALPLRIVTGILNRPNAFPLFSRDLSYICNSSFLVGLSKNVLNELFLRKFLNGLPEPGIVFYI